MYARATTSSASGWNGLGVEVTCCQDSRRDRPTEMLMFLEKCLSRVASLFSVFKCINRGVEMIMRMEAVMKLSQCVNKQLINRLSLVQTFAISKICFRLIPSTEMLRSHSGRILQNVTKLLT